MPRYCKLSRSRILGDSSTITTSPILEFLLPQPSTSRVSSVRARQLSCSTAALASSEALFFNALARASSCGQHKNVLKSRTARAPTPASQRRYASHSAPAAYSGEAANHQRFDSQGRLIIETTAPRQPEFRYAGSDQTESSRKKASQFAANSTLPRGFFSEVESVRSLLRSSPKSSAHSEVSAETVEGEPRPGLDEQMKLLQSIRELEEKLTKAKKELSRSMTAPSRGTGHERRTTVLTKQDYLNLVDLYFYSYNSRFSPESTDASPTPVFLDDVSFVLSANFTKGDEPEQPEEDELYVSPLKEIEERMKKDKLREIAVMQVFIDLLLDDKSSNRALHEAYKELPHPGVAYLPKGVIRLFLQRMSTPWVKTLASKLRYLSLIDDMQEAKLPITVAEWSSAIYLAGKSFSRIETGEVGKAIDMWSKMENEAGVRSSNVTFNILFDIAVRAGKFALGETILQEMHNRNLRLNRLGRVSLMYYHGLRGDGDGVRKAYHDFVEAGEIVDTLVMNCVIASLINAQEPAAAEQVYERMKLMQATLTRGRTEDGQEALFKLHPDPSSTRLGHQMAANELGRMLMHAPHLKKVLPEKHEELQDSMPLTPNFTTFRILLAYHTTVSGDLDRTTILLKEMLEHFDIPLFAVVFQLLFKGFAIHGPQGGPDSVWSESRLNATWKACRVAIVDSRRVASGEEFESFRHLPSVTEINKGMSTVAEASAQGLSKTRTLSMWEELVIDLAAFPRERLKRLQRYHNAQFDEDSTLDQFASPFFQKTHYAAPQPELDDEEGEYTLPDPIRSTMSNPNYEPINRYNDEDDGVMHGDPTETDQDDDEDRPPTAPSEDMRSSRFSFFEPQGQGDSNTDEKYYLHASKPMVCWLLRAYSRVTGDREKVQEIWANVRRVWHPKTEQESQVVIKVLLRCLRDCDRTTGRG